jgi:hypothetical protein
MPLSDEGLIELRERLWRAMVRDTDAPPDPLATWQPMYADALAAVLKRGTAEDWARLCALLRDEEPIHPMLLPALAEALEARGRPKRDGRRRKLSPVEELQAALDVRYLRVTGQSKEQAIESVAQRLCVSDSVVKRALDKRLPSHLGIARRVRVRTGGRF